MHPRNTGFYIVGPMKALKRLLRKCGTVIRAVVYKYFSGLTMYSGLGNEESRKQEGNLEATAIIWLGDNVGLT